MPTPYYVIEVNPRVSRSSALASKATGYPIARVAAKIAVGKRLDEIPNAVTKLTTAAFEPALDYCVVKIPRWPFDKFAYGDRVIGTQMKATGEVMAIDRSFEAALQKAVRSLELGGKSLLWEDRSWTRPANTEGETGEPARDAPISLRISSAGLPTPAPAEGPESEADILGRYPLHPNDLRLWAIMACLRRGVSGEAICGKTGIDKWFVRKLENIVDMERRLLAETLGPELLLQAKRLGFSDVQVATLSDRLPEQVRELRRQWGIRPVYKMVDTCAAEFAAETPYFYSSYESENEAESFQGPTQPDGTRVGSAAVIGSGPIRIGQGIEFDYCSVHSAWALQEAGIKSIMINSNPETVSTDFDTSDRLYFEPLDEESVRDMLENEGSGVRGQGSGVSGQGTEDMGQGARNPTPLPLAPCPLPLASPSPMAPAIVQFGGQTAINLAEPLVRSGMAILGSDLEAIDMAEDRRRFENFLNQLGIPQPPGAAITTVEQALNTAKVIGYPVLVRPSYVLGGRAMEVVYTPSELIRYMTMAVEVSSQRPILIDKYLEGKEVEVDALCDGEAVLIPGIMEHIERAGVHSGDSMAVYPGLHLAEDEVNTIVDYTTAIGLALGTKGLMNVQYVIMPNGRGDSPSPKDERSSSVYVLEVNPRASRTVPFLSKVTGVPMVKVATHVMLGKSLKEQGYSGGLWKRQKLVAIKAPVFSMSKLIGVDTYLGPEMKSTGEVMGIDYTFGCALHKALLAAGLMLPRQGAMLLSIADRDKPESVPLIKQLAAIGYRLYATEGTAVMIEALGIPVTLITKKLHEGHPNVLDVIRQGTVQGVINTLTGDRTPLKDGFDIRRAAAENRVPCFTSLDTARAVVDTLSADSGVYSIQPLPEYLKPRDARRMGH